MASSVKKPVKRARKQAQAAALPNTGYRYQVLLWLIFFAGSLFFIPPCLDRYLVSRFFFLSAVLLGGCFWQWQHWRTAGNWQITGFGLLLFIWYGLNLASVTWAFSWSEGIFFAQKVWLLAGVYWFVRQALAYDEPLVRRTLALITNALTLVVCVLLIIQVGIAFSEFGLDNQHLYDYASGVFGNKGLAADFLFFLLIFNVLFKNEIKNKRLFWLSIGALLVLILVLQTRTVYLAVVAAAGLYLALRIVLEPTFRPLFFRRILPAAVVGLVVLAGLLSWKGQGTTLAERLNPATYLESATARERRFVWYKTDELNAEHFWWGVGNGSWKIWFPSKSLQGAYRLQEKSIVFTRAHNDYLEIRSEMGIVGVTIFTGLFVAAFLAGGLALRRLADAETRQALIVLLAGLLGYCIIQYFDFPRERIEMQAILGLLFAAIVHYSRVVWDNLPGLNAGRHAGRVLAVFAAGLAFNLVLGWHRIIGEIHTVGTMKAQATGNYPQMLHESQKAQNVFYTYSDVTIPLQWFEGIALYQMNRVDEAVVAFEEAYRLNPWAFQVINNYASALVQAKRYREAIPLFEQALAINPVYDEGKFNLSYAWLSLGDTAQARTWLDRVDTIPNPQSDDDRQKNRRILQQKAVFENAIQGGR